MDLSVYLVVYNAKQFRTFVSRLRGVLRYMYGFNKAFSHSGLACFVLCFGEKRISITPKCWMQRMAS